jgi:7-cyano-7-deazaguanine synthase in queuosine biosynthesis
VTYPAGIEVSDELRTVVSSGLAVYLGQFCLAREILVDVALPDSLRNTMLTLCGYLYDVRCWRDRRPYVRHPDLRSTESAAETLTPHVPHVAHARRVVLMWSGGKDSTLAGMRLQEGGLDVVPVHAGVNAGVEHREATAVRQLSRMLSLDPLYLQYEHREFDRFSRRYAREWDIPPHANKVPFGRDLMLAMIALPAVRALGCSQLSFGHDRDCRQAWVSDAGRAFPRNDVESGEGMALLEMAIADHAIPGMRVSAPLESMSELAILRIMLREYPEVMVKTSSCFWPGTNCGRCAKCLRYFLAQRLLGVDVLQFGANPLAGGTCPDLDQILSASEETTVLFGRSTLYCLARLAERSDIRPDEWRLRDFARSARFNDVLPLLDKWEHDLLSIERYGASLASDGSRASFAYSGSA